jgi:hypothetical protein
MWDQTLRLWASTSLSESEPTDSHTRSRGAYLHLGAPMSPPPPYGVGSQCPAARFTAALIPDQPTGSAS